MFGCTICTLARSRRTFPTFFRAVTPMLRNVKGSRRMVVAAALWRATRREHGSRFSTGRASDAAQLYAMHGNKITSTSVQNRLSGNAGDIPVPSAMLSAKRRIKYKQRKTVSATRSVSGRSGSTRRARARRSGVHATRKALLRLRAQPAASHRAVPTTAGTGSAGKSPVINTYAAFQRAALGSKTKKSGMPHSTLATNIINAIYRSHRKTSDLGPTVKLAQRVLAFLGKQQHAGAATSTVIAPASRPIITANKAAKPSSTAPSSTQVNRSSASGSANARNTQATKVSSSSSSSSNPPPTAKTTTTTLPSTQPRTTSHRRPQVKPMSFHRRRMSGTKSKHGAAISRRVRPSRALPRAQRAAAVRMTTQRTNNTTAISKNASVGAITKKPSSANNSKSTTTNARATTNNKTSGQIKSSKTIRVRGASRSTGRSAPTQTQRSRPEATRASPQAQRVVARAAASSSLATFCQQVRSHIAVPANKIWDGRLQSMWNVLRQYSALSPRQRVEAAVRLIRRTTSLPPAAATPHVSAGVVPARRAAHTLNRARARSVTMSRHLLGRRPRVRTQKKAATANTTAAPATTASRHTAALAKRHRSKNPYLTFYREMLKTGAIPNKPAGARSREIKALWRRVHHCTTIPGRVALARTLVQQSSTATASVAPKTASPTSTTQATTTATKVPAPVSAKTPLSPNATKPSAATGTSQTATIVTANTATSASTATAVARKQTTRPTALVKGGKTITITRSGASASAPLLVRNNKTTAPAAARRVITPPSNASSPPDSSTARVPPALRFTVPRTYRSNPFATTYSILSKHVQNKSADARMRAIARAWTRTEVKGEDNRSPRQRIQDVAQVLIK